MPMFSRDNTYYRSLVSAYTPTTRRNLKAPYVSFSVARATLSPRATSSLFVTSAVPENVFSPRRGEWSARRSPYWHSHVLVGLTTVTCFEKLGEPPPGLPLPLRLTGCIIPSLFIRVLDQQDPSSSAWYKLGPPGDPILFGESGSAILLNGLEGKQHEHWIWPARPSHGSLK